MPLVKIHEHPRANLILLDTGLGLERSAGVVLIEITQQGGDQAQSRRYTAASRRPSRNAARPAWQEHHGPAANIPGFDELDASVAGLHRLCDWSRPRTACVPLSALCTRLEIPRLRACRGVSLVNFTVQSG